MKRTAVEAGFPAEGHLTRVEVHLYLPLDYCTTGEAMVCHLNCYSSDTIDHVTCRLQYYIKDVTGRCPKFSSLQLRQAGRHIAFTELVTALPTLEPVTFVRAGPAYIINLKPESAASLKNGTVSESALCGIRLFFSLSILFYSFLCRTFRLLSIPMYCSSLCRHVNVFASRRP